MARLLQYVLDGLGQGAVYALIALGLVIIFRATGHLNIAQGSMALVCAYVVYQLGEWGIGLAAAVAVALLVGFALGAATERLLVRPLGDSNLRVFIATLALMQLLNWLVTAVWGNQLLPDFTSDQTAYPSVFPSADTDFVRVLGATWRVEYLGILLVVLLICGLLAIVFTRTRLGLAMRTVATNPDSARLVGVPIGRIQMLSWGLAGALGGFGGVVLAGVNHNLSPSLMTTVLLYGAAAATLGGFESPLGAVVASLTVGVLKNVAAGLAPLWVGQQLQTTVAFLVVVVVLLVRPNGLFGTSKLQRV